MNHTVLWSRSAQNDLAELWISATDQAALSAAADLMDAVLAVNPLDCGESREQSEFRIMFAFPLAIEFQVDQINRTVVVSAVWRTK